MDTFVALLRAVARAGRGLFDMALMAVGVAPTSLPLPDAAAMPLGHSDQSRERNRQLHGMTGDVCGSDGGYELNPSTGLPMVGCLDTGGNPYGSGRLDD